MSSLTMSAFVRRYLFAMFLGLFFSSTHASQQTVRLTGWTGGFVCEATISINPAILYDINNIKFQIGGPTGTIIPAHWEIDSPTLDMSSTPIGLVVQTATHIYGETNTAFHNGQLSAGDWTTKVNVLGLTPCSDFDDKARLIFDLTP